MERSLSASSIASSSSMASPIIPPSMLRRHPASLIPKFEHDPALLDLMRSQVTEEMICRLHFYITSRETVAHSLKLSQPISRISLSKSFNAVLRQQHLCLLHLPHRQKVPFPRLLNFPATLSFPVWKHSSQSWSKRAMCKFPHYYAH